MELVQHQGSCLDEQMSFPCFPGLRSRELCSDDQASCPDILGIAVSACTANGDISVKRAIIDLNPRENLGSE